MLAWRVNKSAFSRKSVVLKAEVMIQKWVPLPDSHSDQRTIKLRPALVVQENNLKTGLRQHLPQRELNLKVLEEIERAKNRTYPRF